MSYILDALRRADAERERGAVPGIHAQQFGALPGDDEPGERRPWTLWLIVGLTLALAAAIAWNFLARPAAPGPIATPPAAPAQPPAASTPAPALPTPVASVPVAAPVAGPPASAAVPARPAARRSPPARDPEPASRESTSVRGASEARRGSDAPTATRSRSATPERGESGTRASAGAPGSGPAGDAGRVLSLRELPEDVRRGLPNITISGSTYSADKSSRMLMINGHIFREGDAVGGGVVLQEIRRRAAVFEVKGHRYELSF